MLNWSLVSSETLHQAQLNFSSGRTVISDILKFCLYIFLPVTRTCVKIQQDIDYDLTMPLGFPNFTSSGRAPMFIETTFGGLQQSSNMFNNSSSGVTQNYSVLSSSRSSVTKLELSHYAFNDTTTQSFKHNVSSATMDDAMVLEKISHDLLNDINMEMEPTATAEATILMSTINSFSSLLQPQKVDPGAGSSGAIGGSS